MRALVLSLALVVLPNCTHGKVEDANASITRAIARVMIAALPDETGALGNSWDALSTRVSRQMDWHWAPRDPADRPPDAIIRRNGWIQGESERIFVSVEGVGERVTALIFETQTIFTLSVLEALREEGAQVSFQADWEESSEYVISAAGTELALLTNGRICTHSEDHTGETCSNVLTLAFEMP